MKSKAARTTRRKKVDFEKRLEKQSATLKKLKLEVMIEASLERVRTVAMSMRKSDELLTVCKSVFNELRSLGFAGADLRNSQIVINDDAKGLYHGYQYSDRIGGEIAEVPYDLHPVIRILSDKLRRSTDAFADIEISGRALDEWKAFVRTFPQKPDEKLESAEELHYYFYSVGIGALGISTFRSLSKEKLTILQRLRNVFNLSYQRYTDITRAESQTREARIELALERVRAKAMAMQKSDDLAPAVAVIFEELDSLNLGMLRCGIGILNREKRSADVWTTTVSEEKKVVQVSGDESMDIHPLLQGALDAWLQQSDFSYLLEGKDLNEYYRALTRVNFRLPESQSLVSETEGQRQYYYVTSFRSGGLFAFRETPFPDEAKSVMRRFADVFNLTYTRFLDLQKAEAQAREVQIELSLERVRSSAMAMHSSENLSETIDIFFKELKSLGVVPWRCGVGLIDEETRTTHLTTTSVTQQGDSLAVTGTLKQEGHPVLKQIFENWKLQKDYFPVLQGEEINTYYTVTKPQIAYPEYPIESTQYGHFIYFKEGFVFAWTENLLSEEELRIFRKFSSVLSLTYRRFLDLKEAEAQAREARIEAALEKVRSRTIGMQHSEELKEAAALLFQQVQSLGGKALSCGYNIWEEDGRTVVSWMSSPQGGIQPPLRFLLTEDSFYRNFFLAKQRGETLCVEEVSGKKLEDERRYLATVPGFQETIDASVKAGYPLPTRLIHHLAFFSQGFLMFITLEPCPELWDIFKRFGVVFEQTYTRFLDLQKAEAQGREAQIEAALEKVRGRAMAMHSSGDLSATTSAVFNELRRLGVHPIRTGVALYSKQQRRATFYAATSSSENESLAVFGSPEVSVNPCLEMQFRSWLNKENYFPVLKGKELEEYYAALSIRPSVQVESGDPFQHEEYGYYLHFSEGNFYAWTVKPFSEAEMNILQRFKTIIEITFRRYFELQKAEALTREAQIEASLERVRSRTLAMQKSDELAETAAVLFRQLITLGIEPNRLYIAIMKDESGNVEFWITDEDGSKVSSAFTANLQHNPSWKKMFEGWKEGKKSITIDMQGEELQEYFKHLSSLNVPFKGGLSQKRRVQSIAYFSRGFIGMASPHEQPGETTTLLERFAAVFNLTFTRFTDLKLAEAQAHQAHLDLIQLQTEKKRAEEALSELSATQAQLVQQEKLASLGQLTAGIAHEIKNPLNFVNNFSSVSVELIDEVIEEIKNRAPELEKGETPQLLANIKGNLAKIIEHGTRADGIVKSMLQHSRGGGSEIEPTDINALIREYVNLAFHGMRAGGNPINVNISLDLDKTIGNVPLKAQDFSRVILNLCQNAFDAMREKQKSGDSDRPPYLPKLSVRSAHDTNRVKIQIEDNGPGIPEAIRDKILQPFFTTKKGTQGTGLGLSISNDIVKAHGGEISIETNDNGGATFTIAFPTVTAKTLSGS